MTPLDVLPLGPEPVAVDLPNGASQLTPMHWYQIDHDWWGFFVEGYPKLGSWGLVAVSVQPVAIRDHTGKLFLADLKLDE